MEQKNRFESKYREIGQNITFYRRKQGMTQEMLAYRLNISRSHLAAIEAPNSSRHLSMDMFFRIADELDVSPEELLK